MSIKIEKGITNPVRGEYMAALLSMEVGDSFVVPLERTDYIRNSIGLAKREGRRFTTRKTDEGLRVWRTE